MTKLFKKYTSLENSYRQAFVDKCATLGVSEWIATEKIHGANFSFICEPDLSVPEKLKVTPAKRSGTIGANVHGDYDFYDCTNIVNENAPKVIALNDLLWESGHINTGDSTIVYGELAGPGVQKEVDYGTEKFFMAYDVLVLNADKEPVKWVGHDLVNLFCKQVGIKTVPVLATGTLAELLTIDPLFVTNVGSETKSCGEPNYAEGFVVKQRANEQHLPNGSRAILKVKNEKFKEKKNKAGKTPTVVNYTEAQNELHAAFSLYLTENRLRNVLSKLGEVTQKDFGKVSGLLLQDAKVEFERDEYDETAIHPDDWKVLKKSLMNISNQLMRVNWLNILDKTF